MTTNDRYNLERFVLAQSNAYEEACVELSGGRKQGHWMWFIFPQIKGLGHSSTAIEFAISSKAEAQAYLTHPILGPRLIECTRLVVQIEGASIEHIFGYPDYLKFRSCMTLFSSASSKNQIFKDALVKYFDGEPDTLTLEILRNKGNSS